MVWTLLIGIASAAIFSVDPLDSTAYATLGDAISAAADGDRVEVVAGTYSECPDFGGKQIEVVGLSGAASTIIDGSGCSHAVVARSSEPAGTTLEGFTVRNTSGGRGLYMQGSTLELIDVIIEDCGRSGDTSFYGGGAYLDAANLVLTRSTLQGSSGWYGGNVYMSNLSTIDALDSYILDGYAERGGGIYSEVNSYVTVEVSLTSTIVSDNVAEDQGGGLWLGYDHVMISRGSTYTNNEAYDDLGGGLYMDAQSELDIAQDEWTGNEGSSAAAIYVGDYTVLTSEDNLFEANGIQRPGAAIYAASDTIITESDSTFVGQEAATALYVRGTLFVQGSTFEGNGGGVYSRGDAVVERATFIDNLGTAGSALRASNADLEVYDSTFIGNLATTWSGGAIRVSDGALVVEGCLFEDNEHSSGSGGAIGFEGEDSHSAQIELNTFLNNRAADGGGAIYITEASSHEIINNLICGNSAENGGGIYLYDPDTSGNYSAHLWANNLLIENSATERGGGFYGERSVGNPILHLRNNNLLGNTAGRYGAAGAWTDLDIGFMNNVVAWNTGPTIVHGFDGFTGSGFLNSDWYGNSGTLLGGVLSFSTLSNGHLEDDPRFTDWTLDGDCNNDDLTLSSTSTLIDAGSVAYTDADGSPADIGAYGGPYSLLVDNDGDGVMALEDCDDDDATVYPGAAEVCDGVDNDCDDEIDPADAVDAGDWYVDLDGDGYGSGEPAYSGCEPPSGLVSEGEDCDDEDAGVHPGASERCATEVDDDCDGEVNEGDAVDADVWYADGDADGYGDPEDAVGSCEWVDGRVDNDEDCDDTDSGSHPEAMEVAYDGRDQDCDGQDLDDVDGDGYVAEQVGGDDCDDADGAVNPGAEESWYDGVDQNCDGADDNDADGDGYAAEAAGGADCDDADATVLPEDCGRDTGAGPKEGCSSAPGAGGGSWLLALMLLAWRRRGAGQQSDSRVVVM